MKKVRLGISVGDINGVGLELIIKSFQDLSLFEYCNPILYCCKNLVSKYADKAKINLKTPISNKYLSMGSNSR